MMPREFAIVDLFAGPGGLAEGFSSIRNKDGSRPFQIALSVEKEASAFETLRLRSFFRQFDDALLRNHLAQGTGAGFDQFSIRFHRDSLRRRADLQRDRYRGRFVGLHLNSSLLETPETGSFRCAWPS